MKEKFKLYFVFYGHNCKKLIKLEYCFAREKEIVFCQSVPMSINEFVEMTIFLCLRCFSIYDKMQGFIDESGCLFIYLFILRFMQKFKMAAKSGGKTIFAKSCQ